MWCLRILLRVPWTARRSNQSILKEISPGCSLEGLILKLKPQYFGHLMWRPDSLEKNPDLGKDWGQEEKGTTGDEMVGWHHQLNGHGFGWTPGVGVDREAWRAAVHGVTKSRTWLSLWTELNKTERPTNIENNLIITKGEGWGEITWESGSNIYTHYCI